MTRLRSPSLSVQPVKCLSTERAPCPSVSFTVWYDGGVLQGIWAGRQPASCWFTRSRPRSPLTDTGPGGRHSPSGWTWRDRNKEIHRYWQCATHTLVTIWFIYGVSFLTTLTYLLSHRYGSSIFQALTRNCTFKCCSWVLPYRMWLHIRVKTKPRTSWVNMSTLHTVTHKFSFIKCVSHKIELSPLTLASHKAPANKTKYQKVITTWSQHRGA